MYTVYGIENVDYVNRQNRHVEGVRLHCTYSSDKINGSGCEAFWCGRNVNLPSDLKLGDDVNILYNRYGGIEAVVLAD